MESHVWNDGRLVLEVPNEEKIGEYSQEHLVLFSFPLTPPLCFIKVLAWPQSKFLALMLLFTTFFFFFF